MSAHETILDQQIRSLMLNKAIEEERRAVAAVDLLIEELAKAVVPIWHWGDGYGGEIKERLRYAIEEQGLKWQPNSYTKKSQRKSISRYLREQVIARDGLVCQYCQLELHQSRVTLDHKIPVSKGGPDTLDNLTVCCRRCNSRKGAR